MLTVGDLCTSYLDSLSGRPSEVRYRGVYHKYVEQWANQPADQLSRLELIKFQQRSGVAKEQLRKALGLVQQSYRWGLKTINPQTDDLYYYGPNPAEGLTLPLARPRARLASTDELKRILCALPSLHPRQAAFFAVRFTAPSRIKELTETETSHWKRCELIPGHQGAMWHKPTTKNGEQHTVYVAPQAMRFMDALPWSGQYFFVGAHGHHWTEDAARTAWARYMKDLDIEDLQLLDVRRTLASYLYRLHRRQEVDDLTIKALLNHYDGRPVAIYTRIDVEYLAPILQKYADWLWSLSADEGVP